MKKTLQLLVLVITVLTVSITNAQDAVFIDTADNDKSWDEYYDANGVVYTQETLVKGPDMLAGQTRQESPTSGIPGGGVTNLVVPATIDLGVYGAFNVTGIAFQGFAGNITIESVDISALSSTEAPQQAFYGMSSLTSVNLPSTLTKLGTACFQNCSALTSINTENIEDAGGRSCLRNIAVTTLDLSSIVTVGRQAVDGPNIKTLIVGENLTNYDTRTPFNVPALTSLEWRVEDPAAFSPVFSNAVMANVTLYVATQEIKDAYAANAYWISLGLKDIVVGSAPVLSTNSVEQALGFKLYPNPTKGIVSIKNSFSKDASITVYDLNGRSLLSRNINDSFSEINISNFAAGLYIFRVQTGNSEFVQRIMKK